MTWKYIHPTDASATCFDHHVLIGNETEPSIELISNVGDLFDSTHILIVLGDGLSFDGREDGLKSEEGFARLEFLRVLTHNPPKGLWVHVPAAPSSR
jgi:hypothetical protein